MALLRCAYCQLTKHGCDLINSAKEMDEEAAHVQGRWIVEHHRVGRCLFKLVAAPGAMVEDVPMPPETPVHTYATPQTELESKPAGGNERNEVSTGQQ